MLNRRKNPRLPVIKDFGREVHISIGEEKINGIILNLSVGGMLLLTYSNLPKDSDLTLSFDLANIKTKPIKGKIIRAAQKSVMYELAIEFLEIDTLDSKKINRIAIDYNDCENKIDLGAQDVCKLDCSYFQLCEKEHKLKNIK